MSRAKFRHVGAGLVIGSVLLLLVSAGWTIYQQEAIRRIRALPVNLKTAVVVASFAEIDRPPKTMPQWLVPLADTPGRKKFTGLFDPPLKNEEEAKTHGPIKTATEPVGPPPAHIELLEVGFEPFRLQLVGYVGESGNYRAVFTSGERPENFLAREGETLRGLGLTLKKFSVQKSAAGEKTAGPMGERIAQAVMRDDRTGAETLLDSRTVKLTNRPVASVRWKEGEDQVRTVHRGETLPVGEIVYRVNRIQSAPPEIDLVDESPQPARPQRITLRPASGGVKSEIADRSGEISAAMHSSTSVAEREERTDPPN